MRTINPFMAAAHRCGDPVDNAARKNKYVRQVMACATEVKKYRLHYRKIPVGMVVLAHPMEAHAWNKNARAYFAHQATLGRRMLPLLEWQEVGQEAESFVWRVTYRNNGKEAEHVVSALTKAGAKREFESMAPVTAVIRSIERDDDVEGAVMLARVMNGEEPGEGME